MPPLLFINKGSFTQDGIFIINKIHDVSPINFHRLVPFDYWCMGEYYQKWLKWTECTIRKFSWKTVLKWDTLRKKCFYSYNCFLMTVIFLKLTLKNVQNTMLYFNKYQIKSQRHNKNVYKLLNSVILSRVLS